MAGKKVCLIDADPQGSLTASLGYQEPDDIRYTLATIMMKIINEEEIDPTEGILHHEEGVDLVPANIELSGLEVTLANAMSRELILKEYVDQVRDDYDYILIDCMPSLGIMTINALVAADRVLILQSSSISGSSTSVRGVASRARETRAFLSSCGRGARATPHFRARLHPVYEKRAFLNPPF